MEYKIDKAEVLRYLGVRGTASDTKTEALIEECASELSSVVRPKYIYRSFNLTISGNNFSLNGYSTTFSGKTAEERLDGCSSCYLLAATLGIEADTLIRRAQVADMARAVVYDACATDLIEKVCDSAELEISKLVAAKGLGTRDRFSPGYGDLSLSLQRDICLLLDTDRKIGLTHTPDFLLIPTKSVTAIVGICSEEESNNNLTHCIKKCDQCNMKDICSFCR